MKLLGQSFDTVKHYFLLPSIKKKKLSSDLCADYCEHLQLNNDAINKKIMKLACYFFFQKRIFLEQSQH